MSAQENKKKKKIGFPKFFQKKEKSQEEKKEEEEEEENSEDEFEENASGDAEDFEEDGDDQEDSVGEESEEESESESDFESDENDDEETKKKKRRKRENETRDIELEEEDNENRVEAKSRFGLGKVHLSSLNFEQACEDFQIARNMYDRVHNFTMNMEARKKISKKIGDCSWNIAVANVAMGNYDSARNYIQDAKERYESYARLGKKPNPDDGIEAACRMGLSLCNKVLADSYFAEDGINQDKTAEDLYFKAVKELEDESMLGWADATVGIIYMRIAEIYILRADERSEEDSYTYYRRALDDLRHALSAIQNAKNFGDEHPLYAKAIYMRGVTQVKYGQYYCSSEFSQYRTEEREQLRDFVDDNNADIPQDAIEQFEYALDSFLNAKNIFKKHEDMKLALSKTFYWLGWCYVTLKDYAQAILCFKNDLQILDSVNNDIDVPMSKYLSSDEVRRIKKRLTHEKNKHVASSMTFFGYSQLKIAHADNGASTLKGAIISLTHAINLYRNESFLRTGESESNQFHILVSLSDCHVLLEDYIQVKRYLDGALELLQNSSRQLYRHKEKQAYLQAKLGDNFMRLGEPIKAVDAYEDALVTYFDYDRNEEKIKDRTSVLIRLGHAHFVARVYDNALGCYIRARELDVFHDKRLINESIQMYVNMGLIYQDLGNYKEAALFFDKAKFIPNFQEKCSIESAVILSNCANGLFRLGEYEKAQKLNAMAIKAYRSDQEEESERRFLGYIDVLNNMALVCIKLRNYDGALRYLERAKDKFRSRKESTDSIKLASMYNKLGSVYTCLKMYDDAYRSYFCAFQGLVRHSAERSAELSKTFYNIAKVLYHQDYASKVS